MRLRTRRCLSDGTPRGRARYRDAAGASISLFGIANEKQKINGGNLKACLFRAVQKPDFSSEFRAATVTLLEQSCSCALQHKGWWAMSISSLRKRRRLAELKPTNRIAVQVARRILAPGENLCSALCVALFLLSLAAEFLCRGRRAAFWQSLSCSRHGLPGRRHAVRRAGGGEPRRRTSFGWALSSLPPYLVCWSVGPYWCF